MLDTVHVDALPPIYDFVKARYESAGLRLPRTTGIGADYLDQEVINFYCDLVDETSKSYQTIRGCFPEGSPAYSGSKILKRTHVQIAVSDVSCLEGARIVTSKLVNEEEPKHA